MVRNFFDFTSSISKSVWGFNPNRDIKPVHLANGFYKAISNVTNDIALIQKTATGYIKGTSGNTNEQILADITNMYVLDSDEEDELLNKVSDLRASLDLLLTQDRALYENFTSTATLSHFLQISSDPSDNGTGKFLADVLVNDENKEVIKVLREVLQDDRDNIYLLTSPLLGNKKMGPEPIASDSINEIMKTSPHLHAVQHAFLTLTQYQKKLEKTVFLQRVITLGCFAIYLHLINRTLSIDSEGHRGLSPIFLAASEPTKEIREVSRATFSRGRQRIEVGYEEELKKRIAENWGENLNKDQYLELMKSLLPELDTSIVPLNLDTQIWYRFIEDFEGNMLGSIEVGEAFSKAFVRTAFSYFNKTSGNRSNPESVAAFIGKNIGLVYPREAGRGDKYYLPGPRFLDTLVVSLLSPNDEVPIEDFWDKAWEKFGIITGARGTKDIERLSMWGVRQVSPKLASENAKKITAELVKMGYVTEYADDIAMIRGGGISNG